MIDGLSMLAWDRRAMGSWCAAIPGVEVAAPWVSGGPRRGVVVLATCERFEVYRTGDGVEHLVDSLFGADSRVAQQKVTKRRAGSEAARHLLRVAAGLDSRLLGEPHVLGQVRRAGEWAEVAGTIGDGLRRVVGGAVRCGRRVRNETALGRVASTYASVATERVVRTIDAPRRARVGIIGTGAVAMEVGEGLRRSGVRSTTVFGRHAERTQKLATHLGGRASPLERIGGAVPRLDALITATSAPHPIVGAHDLRAAQSLLVVDLGMPSNVERGAQSLATISYVGLDELAPGHAPSGAVVEEAEAIVEEELRRLVGGAVARPRSRSVARRGLRLDREVTR